MLKAPSIEGAFSFQRHPYRGSHRGVGYWWRQPRPNSQPYPSLSAVPRPVI